MADGTGRVLQCLHGDIMDPDMYNDGELQRPQGQRVSSTHAVGS